MKSLKIIFILLLALAPAALPEALQSSSASAHARTLRTSRIVGTVLDKDDSRIAGATIKIENAEFNRVVLSGDQGDFEVRLPAGVYRFTAEMDGFEKVVLSPLRVKAGARESVSIHMEIKEPAGLLKVD
jgi:hypothetical protein